MRTVSSSFVLRFLICGVLWFCASAFASPEDQQPVITSIRQEGTNVVVIARVPAGIKKVTLECRSRLGAGTWAPRAVIRLDGVGGEVALRLPKSERLEVLRVRADAEEPLPAAFYSGTNSFSGQPSSSGGLVNLFEGPGDARGGTGPTAGDPSREVVESDIWKIRGDRLYFFNQYRGLQIIDIGNPDTATVKGTLSLPAAGEEMYLLGADHAVLLASDGCGWSATGPESQALIVGVENDSPRVVASLPIPGYITESRLVGSALYVASQTYQVKTNGTNSITWEWGTLVSAFDLANPAAPVTRNSLWYPGYGSVVAANDVFLFVVTPPDNWWKSVVRCIDITEPDGTMHESASIAAAGRVPDKFKMNWRDGVFTVISQVQSNGRLATKLETFRLPHPASAQPGGVVKLGLLDLGERERLHATRFDGERVYIVTFFTPVQMDPLWVVSLADPANPKVAGRLEIPGFSTFIEPLEDRLVAVGIETNRSTVSLFNVADPASPGLLSRIPLGSGWSWTEANSNEDAFSVLPDAGLILVPFSGNSASGYVQAVQLVDLNRDSLAARGVIERGFLPRRSTLHNDRVIVISGLEFLSVDATDRDHPQTKLELPLAWSVDQLFLQGDHLLELTTGASWWSSSPTPTVRVALASDPNRVLNEVALPNRLPILGAAVRDGRLYLAQGRQEFGTIIYLDGDTNQPAPPTNGPTLFLSIYDVRALPAVQLVGQTDAVIDSLGWGATFQSIWPKPGLLVLAGGGGGYWDPWITFGAVGPALDGPGLWRPVYWGGNGGRLIAFDVSDATAPEFLSDVNLAENQWWSFSSAYTTDGLVYLSHQAFEKPAPVIQCDDSGSCRTNPPPDWVWLQRWYLDVVDYADAKDPTVRKPVNIPGTLRGISHNGSILYTVGPHWKTDTNWWYDGPQYLDASAYDGVEAHLIDSVALSQYWSNPTLVKDANIFVGRPAETADGKNALEVWTLTSAGKLTRLSQTVLDSAPYQFVNFGNLLAVQASDILQLFDVTDPAAPVSLISDRPDGCVWYDLNKADGVLNRGLWLPLGIYGVATVTITSP
jgi:hypothetical protein